MTRSTHQTRIEQMLHAVSTDLQKAVQRQHWDSKPDHSTAPDDDIEVTTGGGA